MSHCNFILPSPNSQETMNFVPIMGPREPKLIWNKIYNFYNFCEFVPLQVKLYHIFLAWTAGIHRIWALWYFYSKAKKFFSPQKYGIWIQRTRFMHIKFNNDNNSNNKNVIIFFLKIQENDNHNDNIKVNTPCNYFPTEYHFFGKRITWELTFPDVCYLKCI